MTATATETASPLIVYPDSDGKPMADNTKQAMWIVVLFDNLLALFRERLDVFVAANLFWYVEEGFPEIRTAPDVLVVFGRPKGDRGSYKQWEEDNIPITVAFEILSPGNTHQEMVDKHLFYEEHGVEEYYLYDPDRNRLEVHLHQGGMLRPFRPAHGFVSPRLGIRFDLSGPEMVVYRSDGRRFLSFEELEAAREQAQKQADEEHRLRLLAEQQGQKAQKQADEEHQQRLLAEQNLDKERQQRLAAELEVEQSRQRLRRLRELSRKARQQQASAEELHELERLEDERNSSDGL